MTPHWIEKRTDLDSGTGRKETALTLFEMSAAANEKGRSGLTGAPRTLTKAGDQEVRANWVRS
jgi:hypothetical protein